MPFLPETFDLLDKCDVAAIAMVLGLEVEDADDFTKIEYQDLILDKASNVFAEMAIDNDAEKREVQAAVLKFTITEVAKLLARESPGSTGGNSGPSSPNANPNRSAPPGNAGGAAPSDSSYLAAAVNNFGAIAASLVKSNQDREAAKDRADINPLYNLKESVVLKLKKGIYVSLPEAAITGIVEKKGKRAFRPIPQSQAEGFNVLSKILDILTEEFPALRMDWQKYRGYYTGLWDVLTAAGVNAADHTIRSVVPPGQSIFPIDQVHVLTLMGIHTVHRKSHLSICNTCGLQSCSGVCPFSKTGAAAPVGDARKRGLARSDRGSGRSDRGNAQRPCINWGNGRPCSNGSSCTYRHVGKYGSDVSKDTSQSSKKRKTDGSLSTGIDR